MASEIFDIDCTRCPRLAGFLETLREKYPSYHNLPVAPFGAAAPRLLIVGLAPGMHGANATGRPFTGDHAGIMLYETLFDAGVSNKRESNAQDKRLRLRGTRISNAVKCLPPQNKPVGSEINECNSFLRAELASLSDGAVIFALGGIAHRAIIKALALRQADFAFAHAAEHVLPRKMKLIDSYHCSRYNTNTKRLTQAMFSKVVKRAVVLAKIPSR